MPGNHVRCTANSAASSGSGLRTQSPTGERCTVSLSLLLARSGGLARDSVMRGAVRSRNDLNFKCTR